MKTIDDIRSKIRRHMLRNPRANTTDSSRRVEHRERPTRDTILTPPTAAELAANQKRTYEMAGLDLGRTWTGESLAQAVRSAIADLPRENRGDAVRAVRDALEEFGAADDDVTLTSGSMPEGEGPFGSTSRASINAAHAKFWADKQQRPLDRVVRARDSAFPRNGQTQPADSNRANAAFWAKQEPFRLGKEFGKG